jgi:DNA repair exonuclease SbcCD nuclease subunit
MQGIHWGQVPEDFEGSELWESNFIAWHVTTWDGENLPWPQFEGLSAKDLLKKYSQYDLILTGHIHQTFVVEYEGRLLVNPGSMTRQQADQEKHRPCVFLWYQGTNEVERVNLPFGDDQLTRVHIDHKKKRDDRIEAFVSRLDTDWESALSFEDNMERFLHNNKIKKDIVEIIQKAIES